jgi:DNA-binding NarL/FixJ family response regulator
MLRKLLASGMKAPAIALKMNRTLGAIQSRKSKLKAKGKWGKTQSE